MPMTNCLGEEGKGFIYLMSQLPQERLSIAVGTQASAQKAFDETVEFTKSRKAFAGMVFDFQNTRFVLADLKAKLQVGWAHLDWAIQRHLKGELTPTEGAAAKLWHTELQWEVMDKCLQLHGGAGYMNEYPIARSWRAARVSADLRRHQRDHEGTDRALALATAAHHPTVTRTRAQRETASAARLVSGCYAVRSGATASPAARHPLILPASLDFLHCSMHMPPIEASCSVIGPSGEQAPPRSFQQASLFTRGVILPRHPCVLCALGHGPISDTISMSFAHLGLAEPLVRALEAKGYTTPTPIQAQAIPTVLDGPRPARHRADRHRQDRGVRAAVDPAPRRQRQARPADALPHARPRPDARARQPDRRERARLRQVLASMSVATVFGGTSINKNRQDMARGVDILVATPGRLLDLIEQRFVNLAMVEILVLDEADQMLDLGFIHALQQDRAACCPRQRQTLFFSATMPNAIRELADQFLQRSGDRLGRARRDHRRARRSVRHLRQPGGEAGAADDPAARPGGRACAGLHAHQARRRPRREAARRQRHRRQRDPRQQEPAAARARAGRVQVGQGQGAGRDRHRRARHRRVGRQPRRSTSSCPTCPSNMSTASAAPRAPAPAGIAISFVRR